MKLETKENNPLPPPLRLLKILEKGRPGAIRNGLNRFWGQGREERTDQIESDRDAAAAASTKGEEEEEEEEASGRQRGSAWDLGKKQKPM